MYITVLNLHSISLPEHEKDGREHLIGAVVVARRLKPHVIVVG